MTSTGLYMCDRDDWSSGQFHSIIWIRRCYNVSGLYFKCIDGELRTYPYRDYFASYARNIIQRIRNVLHVTGRRCYNIPGTSFKVLEEAVTTCQERLASYLQKISQRIRNVLQVTWRRCYNLSGTSGKLVEEEFTTYKERLASYLQVGRCCKYQERLACYLTGNCCNVAGICLMDYLPKYKQVPFWSPTQHVPAQVSPSVNLKVCIPWGRFPKPTPCPSPIVSKCPLNPPQVFPSVPNCPQVPPKPTPSVPSVPKCPQMSPNPKCPQVLT